MLEGVEPADHSAKHVHHARKLSLLGCLLAGLRLWRFVGQDMTSGLVYIVRRLKVAQPTMWSKNARV